MNIGNLSLGSISGNCPVGIGSAILLVPKEINIGSDPKNYLPIFDFNYNRIDNLSEYNVIETGFYTASFVTDSNLGIGDNKEFEQFVNDKLNEWINS